MKNIIPVILVFILAISCTKDVPEYERRSAKSLEESAVKEVINQFYFTYNSGDVESAGNLLDENYKAILPDSTEINGIEEAISDLFEYRKQYPDGKWEVTIDEVSFNSELAYVISTSSFVTPNPIENKLSPIYSEKSIRILTKNKNKSWKIFRYLAVPTFTYDNK